MFLMNRSGLVSNQGPTIDQSATTEQAVLHSKEDLPKYPVTSESSVRQRRWVLVRKEDPPKHPALAANIALVGEMQGTGFQNQQWLIQRDGRFIQVTELLYRIAEQANGRRTLKEIAAAVTENTEWSVEAEHVEHIIRTKLMPLGLIATADGRVVGYSANRARSPLQINLRKILLGPQTVDALAQVLQILFAPLVLIPLLVVTVLAHGWLYFVHGVGSSIQAALYTPGGLLLVLLIMVVSGLVHEFGHAAALRYGGGKARGMGTGLYLVYPTFYTDTSDAYRLGRWARLRTDLGGIYFHLLFALGIMALYFVTREEVLLAVVLLINGDILYQLIPFVRLDGYWALADLTGIPDFFSQMGPFLRSKLSVPGMGGEKLPDLKPWVQFIFLSYIVLTIPVLAIFLVIMVANFPSFITFAWDTLLMQTQVFAMVQSVGNTLAMAAVASQILLLLLSILAGVYFLFSIVRQTVAFLWKWSKPTLPRRLAGSFAAVAMLALVAFLWTPSLSAMNSSVVNGPAGTKIFEVTDRLHVTEPVVYPQNPPVGGNHWWIWQNCGFYDQPIANEYAVHSLEHGAVWITYRPDLPQAQLDKLHRLAQRESYVLVSPMTPLPTAVVASAWDRQLQLDSADNPKLEEFVHTFQLGRQAPERGGGCTGGIGQPK